MSAGAGVLFLFVLEHAMSLKLRLASCKVYISSTPLFPLWETHDFSKKKAPLFSITMMPFSVICFVKQILFPVQ